MERKGEEVSATSNVMLKVLIAGAFVWITLGIGLSVRQVSSTGRPTASRTTITDDAEPREFQAIPRPLSKLETELISNIRVARAGTREVNGLYRPKGKLNGSPHYTNGHYQMWRQMNGHWAISKVLGALPDVLYQTIYSEKGEFPPGNWGPGPAPGRTPYPNLSYAPSGSIKRGSTKTFHLKALRTSYSDYTDCWHIHLLPTYLSLAKAVNRSMNQKWQATWRTFTSTNPPKTLDVMVTAPKNAPIGEVWLTVDSATPAGTVEKVQFVASITVVA